MANLPKCMANTYNLLWKTSKRLPSIHYLFLYMRRRDKFETNLLENCQEKKSANDFN